MSSVGWGEDSNLRVSLSNHNPGKGLVEEGIPALSFPTGVAAWEGSVIGEGKALAKPFAVPPSSPQLPLVTRQRTYTELSLPQFLDMSVGASNKIFPQVKATGA